MEFYARCPFGLEKTVAGELEAMGIRSVRPLSGGVAFFGELEQAYRACLWLRAASRVLLVLGRFAAGNAEELYSGARAIAWQEHITPESTFSVHARGVNAELRNTQFSALKVKDALCDAMVAAFGQRPNVDSRRPDVRLELSLRSNKATLFLDLSGEPLHRRQYRTPGVQGEAPLKENLAAGILLLSGWGSGCGSYGNKAGSSCQIPDATANAVVAATAINSAVTTTATKNTTSATKTATATAPTPQLLFDPLCGTGTLLLEAACISTDRAPGLTRDYWGFLGWLGHDQAVWDELLDEADQRFERGLEKVQEYVFVGSDSDRRAIALARESAKRLGFANITQFEVAKAGESLSTLTKYCGNELPAQGMIVTNPPYAHRLGEEEDLPVLYEELAGALMSLPGTWTLHIITSDASIDEHLLRSTYATDALYNGKIEAALRHYRLADNVTHSLDVPTPDGKNVQLEVLEAGTEQFVARLRKVAKERRKWAKREGISCYRIYDADLPDYAVAIDRYSGVQSGAQQVPAEYCTLAEYKAPKEIDPAKAQRRLSDVLAVMPQALGVPADHIICKTREQARGGEQYAEYVAGSAGSTSLVVQEDGYRFLLDLSGHLDTGLFLDHRLTRAKVGELVREMCRREKCGNATVGLRFLNLFAYTGTVSVYAAAAGATDTTTVDLSNTYLEWAQKNMRLNGLATEGIEVFGRGDAATTATSNTHRFIRADVLEWLQVAGSQKQRYDLIFVDPPTFSNSKRMGERTWDVQRDHVQLLKAVVELLSADGEAIFSCNLRSFKLDDAALQAAGIRHEDISAATIPHDFARNPKIHKCYRIARG